MIISINIAIRFYVALCRTKLSLLSLRLFFSLIFLCVSVLLLLLLLLLISLFSIITVASNKYATTGNNNIILSVMSVNRSPLNYNILRITIKPTHGILYKSIHFDGYHENHIYYTHMRSNYHQKNITHNFIYCVSKFQ